MKVKILFWAITISFAGVLIWVGVTFQRSPDKARQRLEAELAQHEHLPEDSERAVSEDSKLRIFRQMGFILEESDSEEVNRVSITDLSEQMEVLPMKTVDELFSKSLAAYPRHRDKILIGWAWELKQRGQCPKALRKIGTASTEDVFWARIRKQIENDCPGAAH